MQALPVFTTQLRLPQQREEPVRVALALVLLDPGISRGRGVSPGSIVEGLAVSHSHLYTWQGLARALDVAL